MGMEEGSIRRNTEEGRTNRRISGMVEGRHNQATEGFNQATEEGRINRRTLVMVEDRINNPTMATEGHHRTGSITLLSRDRTLPLSGSGTIASDTIGTTTIRSSRTLPGCRR